MLRQASIGDLRSGAVKRRSGHIAVTMRRYPRGLLKTLWDEYLNDLAPPVELLDDFHAAREKLKGDHNKAFEKVRYESRFPLAQAVLADVGRLAKMAREKDVYLVCQCEADQRCHRDLLLILARELCRSPVEPPRFAYPLFEKRVQRLRKMLAHGARKPNTPADEAGSPP